MFSHWMVVPVFAFGFLLASLWIGVRAGKGKIHTTSDHVVGARSLGVHLVFFVSVGEIYSSVAFLGQPGWAYEHGAGMLLPVGTFIPLMAFWLGPKIWQEGKVSGLVTQAQFFGVLFRSELLRGLTAVLALVGLIPYMAVQMMGGGYILSITTRGRIPFWLGALLAFGIVAIYVYSGGLRGISWVAVLKGIFMAVTGVYIVLRVVRRYYGGISELFHRLATESPAHLTLPGPEHFVTYTFWTTTLLVSLCAFYMWPHLFANFYAAESPRVIRKQAIFLPLYNILTLMFMLVGFAGILVLPRIRPDTVMVEMIMRAAPLWLVALFCTGALSASMITGAACSLAAAATLGNDLIQPRLGLEDVKLRKLIQGLIFLVVAAAYVMALLRPATIVYMILMAYGFTAQLFPVVLAALYRLQIGAGGAIAGLLVGLGIVTFLVFGPVSSPFGVHPGLLGLAANVTTMVLVSSWGRRKSPEVHRRNHKICEPV